MNRKDLINIVIGGLLSLPGCGNDKGAPTPVANTVPVADAGGDVSSTTGSAVILDGSGSRDDDGDALSYTWEFASVANGSSLSSTDILGADTMSPSFLTDMDGDYVIRLVVHDGTAASVADTVTVTASASGNVRPATFALPDTGQTRCYDNTSEITCPSAGESFYGQDAHYGVEPISYTDNGNGTVTDEVTGLVWQQEDDNTQRSWTDAGLYCKNLIIDSHDDWGLPRKKELMTILNYGLFSPSIDAAMFPNTNSTHYWTATADARNENFAWTVTFGTGYVSRGDKTTLRYVRCVRHSS